LARGHAAEMPGKWIFAIVIVAGLVCEFYCITMNCALTKFGQQMERNEWEMGWDAKIYVHIKKHF